MNGKKWYLVLSILILSITPIAIKGSAELNIDNSVGVLFTSLLCFSLLLYQYTNKKNFFILSICIVILLAVWVWENRVECWICNKFHNRNILINHN